MYQIKLDQFEGPLDLLLNLIEEQKLDVTRLSLAKVADQYLDYINKRESISLGSLADFLTVASRLILIKSRALLPTLELSEDEEREIKDLEKQLDLYRKFKKASEKIGAAHKASRRSFSREAFSGMRIFFSPPKNFNFFDLKITFKKILSEIPVLEKLEEEMVREVVTLEDKINQLQDTLNKRLEATFSEITAGAKDKIEIIVSFLAMLELVKQRVIQVEQSKLFEEIRMKSCK